MKAQEQRAREMSEDSNQLIEHYNVVKRACKMLYGEKSVKKVEDHDQGSHSSEDALNSINNSPNQGAGKCYFYFICLKQTMKFNSTVKSELVTKLE